MLNPLRLSSGLHRVQIVRFVSPPARRGARARAVVASTMRGRSTARRGGQARAVVAGTECGGGNRIEALVKAMPVSKNGLQLADQSFESSFRRRRTLEKGFNSDVVYRGMSFHVQSEDWGLQNPYLVSRVYQNGAVVKSVKTSYTEVLRPAPGLMRAGQNSEEIRSALREQHQKILDLLLSGKLI